MEAVVQEGRRVWDARRYDWWLVVRHGSCATVRMHRSLRLCLGACQKLGRYILVGSYLQDNLRTPKGQRRCKERAIVLGVNECKSLRHDHDRPSCLTSNELCLIPVCIEAGGPRKALRMHRTGGGGNQRQKENQGQLGGDSLRSLSQTTDIRDK